MNREDIIRPGNTAVVTGAALGIGRALAHRLATEGMNVVMADLQSRHFEDTLASVRDAAPQGPNSILGVVTDVSNPEQVAQLKTKTIDTFGKVHFLANNAVTRGGQGLDADLEEWRYAMDVNLWGPVYGVRAFLPAMLENPEPSAIVNVGSKQGITNPPGHPIYNMTKSAIKTYTENLQHELRSNPDNDSGRKVTSHLLVPGWTTVGFEEHKPGAWHPEQVVDRLLTGIAENRFYIVCQDNDVTADMDRSRIIWGAEDITENRPPLSRWHPDYAQQAKRAGT